MSLFSELKRRNVFRVGVAYVVAAWLILQVLDVIAPILSLADWIGRVVLTLLAIGFFVTLILAWIYELTPAGVQRDSDVDAEERSSAAGRKLDFIIIGVLAVAVAFFAIDKFRTGGTAASLGHSIAVLPFKNMTGQAQNQPFTIGIHDDILTHIAKISGLKVISRTSVERLDPRKSVREIGALLDVATVLEGGVQRIGDRVRINVQLIDARNDQHLWAETFDRQLTTQDIFSIQSDIAAAITRTLRATLSPRDTVNLNREPTANFAAYEAYLRGRQLVVLRNSDDLSAAIDRFSEAIALDPDYAVAHVGLADAYMLLIEYGQTPFEETITKAERAIATALKLDPQLATAYASKGLSHSHRGEFAAAEAAYKRAIELDSNDATAYHWYGNRLITVVGREAEAIANLHRARELDPLSPVINVTLGEALEKVGRFDEAMALYRKVIDIEPAYAGAYNLIGMQQRFVRARLDEAVRWHLKEQAVDPARDPSILAYSLMELGHDAGAEYWIKRARASRPDQFWPNAAQVFLYGYRGQDVEALAAARRLSTRFPGNAVSALTYVRLGLFEEARTEIMDNMAELNCDDPQVTQNNRYAAIHLSLALEKTGNRACAQRLLSDLYDLIQRLPRLGGYGFGFMDVEILARQGKTDEAIAVLKSVVAEKRLADWWWQGERSPHTVSIQQHPEFKAIMANIRSEMAQQLERVRQFCRGPDASEHCQAMAPP